MGACPAPTSPTTAGDSRSNPLHFKPHFVKAALGADIQSLAIRIARSCSEVASAARPTDGPGGYDAALRRRGERSRGMISCSDFIAQLIDYLDSDAEPAAARAGSAVTGAARSST